MTDEQVANWVVLIIVGGAITIGLVSIFVGQVARLCYWLADQWRGAVERAEQNMSSRAGGRITSNSNQSSSNSPATTTPANNNNAVATSQNVSNELLLHERASALAAMVHAGKVGETDGIKIVFGVSPSSSNPRYQAARAALKEELERLREHYPQRTPEQDALRKELGLSQK